MFLVLLLKLCNLFSVLPILIAPCKYFTVVKTTCCMYLAKIIVLCLMPINYLYIVLYEMLVYHNQSSNCDIVSYPLSPQFSVFDMLGCHNQSSNCDVVSIICHHSSLHVICWAVITDRQTVI